MSAVATKGERKDQKFSCYTIAGDTYSKSGYTYNTHVMSEQTLIAQWCKQEQHINIPKKSDAGTELN